MSVETRELQSLDNACINLHKFYAGERGSSVYIVPINKAFLFCYLFS